MRRFSPHWTNSAMRVLSVANTARADAPRTGSPGRGLTALVRAPEKSAGRLGRAERGPVQTRNRRSFLGFAGPSAFFARRHWCIVIAGTQSSLGTTKRTGHVGQAGQVGGGSGR